MLAFPFAKKVKHKGEGIGVDMTAKAFKVPIVCYHCGKIFKSLQGRGFHLKAIHNSKSETTQVLKTNDERISSTVKYVLDNVVNKVVSTMAKSEGAKKMANKKRHQYSATFKAEAISAYKNGASQENIAELFGVTQSQVSRWLKKKQTVLEDAASSHRKQLLKGRRSTKYFELYETLFKEFLKARSKGQVINFSWLWSKAKKIQLNIDPKVDIKHHVIVRFLQKRDLRICL